jgi:hypothetical protein
MPWNSDLSVPAAAVVIVAVVIVAAVVRRLFRRTHGLPPIFHTRNDNGQHSVYWSRSRFGRLKVPSWSRDDPAAVYERTTARSPWLHEISGLRLVEGLASRFDRSKAGGFDRLKAGGVTTAATSKVRAFDFAHGKPFDSAHGGPFDFSRGGPFDSVHEGSFGGAYGCRAVSGHRTHRE